MDELRVVVVGSSISGLCCAHALFHHHHSSSNSYTLSVLVLEKARSLKAAGAGLGLDAPSCSALQTWGIPILDYTLPLSSEENRVVIHGDFKTVARDDQYGHRAAHWSDLHRLLYESLPEGCTFFWGREVLSFEEAQNGERKFVRVHARNAETNALEQVEGHLYIAADGVMSITRRMFLTQDDRRFRGYCAWRGVLDASTEEGRKLKSQLLCRYPDLGHCLYFDINVEKKTHAVLYELTGNRLNWLWYVNQPEPTLQGSSVTLKANENSISKMQKDAASVWTPELAALMQATPEPFINAIFDRDPSNQFVWGQVVLVGEAAHPTSPHGLRSTNMSILDADTLGKSIAKWGLHIEEALKEYQLCRVPITSQQVLFSRHLGQVKQGMSGMQMPRPSNFPDAEWEFLLQKNMFTFCESVACMIRDNIE